jgi:hypothetical protein
MGRVSAIQDALKELKFEDDYQSAEARANLGASAIVPVNSDMGDCGPDSIRLIAAVAGASTAATPGAPRGEKQASPFKLAAAASPPKSKRAMAASGLAATSPPKHAAATKGAAAPSSKAAAAAGPRP